MVWRPDYTESGSRSPTIILTDAHHKKSDLVRGMNRASYTVDFKLSVVEWVKNGGKSLREASKQFGVDRKCIRQWVRGKTELGSARLRQGPQTRKLHGGRCPRSEELDRLVLAFLLDRQRLGLHVRDHELKEKAMQTAKLMGLEDFKASPSWLKGWKARNGFADREQRSDVLGRDPVGSSAISHVAKMDTVLLTPPHQSPLSYDNQASSSGDTLVDTPHSPKNPSPQVSHVTSHMISHVITPDHTYCQPPTTTTDHLSLTSDIISSALPTTCITNLNVDPSAHPSPSYVDLLSSPMSGHLLETADQLLSEPVPSYCCVQRMCVPSSDPVMSSTQVDHFSELDVNIPLVHEEVVISGETRSKVDLPSLQVLSALSPSLTSLSPPKRSSVESRSLLWPSLGCSRSSPVTFPEFHDFTDPLTGLLANRRSHPVFPAGPQILMSTSETI